MWRVSGAIPSELVSIPAGVAGTRATLALMARIADAGARDVTVREAAIRILRSSNAPAHNPLAELRAIFEWVRDHIRYTRDPLNLETLQTPARTLAWSAGDCDDMATLLVALARTVDIPARFVFRSIGTGPRRAGFNHVYVVANVGGRTVAMDPIYRGTPFGWQHPRPTVQGDFPLWAT